MALQRGGRALLTSLRLAARHVDELCRELAPLLALGIVKSLVALPPRDLLLVVALPSGEHLRLRLSASPDLPRLFLQSARQKHPQGPVGPFFRTVQEHLVGARLAGLRAVGQDRVARVDFDGLADPAQRRALILELTGRHANMVLVDGADRVLAVLVPAPPERDLPRLAQGGCWSPPPGKPPAGAPPAPLAELLLEPPRPGSDEAGPHPRAPLSWRVERVLGAEVAAEAEGRAQRDLARRLERKLARTRSNLEGLRARAAAADEAERVREDGDLLKANRGRIARGASEVEVLDFFSTEGARRRIALDPKLSPSENVERTFARYRKLLRAQASVHQDLAFATERAAELEALLERLRGGEDPEALELEVTERGLLPPAQAVARPASAGGRKPEPAPRVPYRTFRGAAGSEIRVGRSARDNDELTLRHCKGSDLWLHTADAPGSHVVLRLDKGATPDPEEVLDAAHLAVHFSPLAGARKADVHVAPRKLVHKPKGAKPGLVTLSGGKVLAVRLQPERLARLVESGRPSTPPAPSPPASD